MSRLARGPVPFLVLALGLALVPVSAAAAAAIVMKPYLQAVGENEVTVMVECDSNATVTVQYGTTASYGSSATTTSTLQTNNSTYVHRVRLTGLQANTLYHYRASQGGPWTDDATFTTAAPAGTSFRFVFMSDFQTVSTVHDTIAARARTVDQPRFGIYGGDMASSGATYSDWKNHFFRANQLELIARSPFFGCVGNHDGWGQNTQAFLQAPASASGTQAYYSFNYGDAHVLILNNQVSDSPGSAQYNFALSDLSSATSAWKIVAAHYPAYSAGSHGEDADMIAMTTNIFEPNGVDLVLGGHNHFYQHNLVNGIQHVIICPVGPSPRTPGTASYTQYSVSSNCYGIIDITPTTLDLTAYDPNGAVLHTIHLSKGPPAIQAPTNLSASTVSSSQINLSWTDNSSNETRFRIERAPFGGAFSFLANVNANITTYSNTGLSGNTTYRYRVRAENATDVSTFTPEASATTQDGGGGGTIDIRVLSGSDDAEERADGSMYLDSSDLEMVFDGSDQTVGMRFLNITVPPGATVTQAYVQFKVDEAMSGATSLTIAGQAADNAGTFLSGANNISSRSLTSTAVPWAPAAWNTVGQAGADQRTPDLSAVIQEIVQRPGWASGNALVLIVTGTGERVAEAFEGDAAGAPLLHLEFSSPVPPAPPAAPSGLSASTVSSSQINLSWTDNASDETGFKIERKLGAGGTWSQIAMVGANATSYQNMGLSASTTYYYRVRAYNGDGDSSYSNEANATTQAPPPTPPAAPSGLTASAVSSSQINLSWTDNASDETGFKIERKLGAGGTWSQIAAVGANVTTYNNTGLSPTTTYDYRVRATNSAGDSAYSNEANATTPAPPGGPGLTGEYYDNVDFTGYVLTRTDAQVNFNWGTGSPDAGVGADTFSVRWTGRVQAEYSEVYTFYTNTDDGVRLWVNGELLVDQWVNQSATEYSGSLSLTAGEYYTIQMDYYENTGNAVAQLSWESASTPKGLIPQAQFDPATGPPDARDNDGDGQANDVDPDDDNDGIPDLQDTDRDGDGVSNVAEDTAGTDPDDKNSFPGAGGGGSSKDRCGATGLEFLLLLALARALRRAASR